MPRTPTGKPRGRPVGTGKLGDVVRLTVRLPADLYARLTLFAEGRHYQRGDTHLSDCARDALEHFLTCPYKQQTRKRVLSEETSISAPLRLLIEAPPVAPLPLDCGAQEEAGVSADALEVSPGKPERPPLPPVRQPADDTEYDPGKFQLGKLCPRHHDYRGTGQSVLRIKDRHCRACDRVRVETQRLAKRTQALAAGTSSA